MTQNNRKILVTNALPYANGSIHMGHLVGYIQADIWVRFQKMCGNDCVYVCADDAHGTPIMLRAEQEKITPEQLIDFLSTLTITIRRTVMKTVSCLMKSIKN